MSEIRGSKGTEEIAAFIEGLKLKPAIVGGVDKEDALLAIKKVYSMFTDIYKDEVAKIKESSNEKLEQSNRLITKLQERQASLEKTLELESSGTANELREKEWQERLEKLKRNHEADLGKEESLVKTLKEEVAEERRKAKEKEKELLQEISKLEDKMLVVQKDAELLQKNYQRDLALARAGAEERSETLEEIYIEAKEMRERTRQTAKVEAEEIISEAKEEADKIHLESEEALQVARAEAERILEESREEAKAVHSQIIKESEEKYHEIQQEIVKAEQRVIDAQNKVEEASREADEIAEDIRREADERLAAAEEALEEARKEAKSIVDSAQIPYMKECERYNSLLVQLSDLRAGTVRSIQESVNRLSNLVFDMTSEGIKLDAENSIGLIETEVNIDNDDN